MLEFLETDGYFGHKKAQIHFKDWACPQIITQRTGLDEYIKVVIKDFIATFLSSLVPR